MTDLKELRRLAAAALSPVDVSDQWPDVDNFTDACDPTTIITLLDRIEKREKALRRIGLPGREITYCRDGHEEAVLMARAELEKSYD